jgi:ubiquinone/menaquinone biosynthesis C-methylase UbiE
MEHYDAPGFARRYAEGRRMSHEAMRPWIDAILATVDRTRVSAVLDLGCGTGRFLDPLHRAFDADVLGIDRSLSMLREAQLAANHRIRLIKCDAERLPVRNACIGFAFASMVYHHLRHPEKVLLEVSRILGKDDYFCIRTSTRDVLNRIEYVKFFPSALAYNVAKLPSYHDVVACAEHSGFFLIKHLVLNHLYAKSREEYLNKIGQRVNSDLVAVPDDEFRSGLDAMERTLMHPSRVYPVTEPIDLFIFKIGRIAP